MNEELYTPQEVAELLKIKKNTVYELIKRGELKCRKIGKQFRIRKDELEEYLNTPDESLDVKVGSDLSDIQGLNETRKEFNENNSVNLNSTSNPVFNHSVPEDYIMSNSKYINNGLVICGQDILLEILCNYLSAQIPDIPIFRSYQGSYNGLYSLYQDKVDVATVHLWDGETDEYNKQHVKRMLPGTAYNRIHLIKRMQGFYVAEGNPKSIKSFKDLTRSDVTMVNREKGSGTRILLDEYLLRLGISKNDLTGYDKEMTSHLACAGAVARGSADASMGIERISRELKGIDFVPIQMESYDMVIKQDAMKYEWYHKLIAIINSVEFKEEIIRMSGYDITDMGKLLD